MERAPLFGNIPQVSLADAFASTGSPLPSQVAPAPPAPQQSLPSAIMSGLTNEQKLMLALLVLAVLYLAYEAGRSTAPTPSEAMKKASTDRLARNLRDRLERNGGGTPAVRKYLEELSGNA